MGLTEQERSMLQELSEQLRRAHRRELRQGPVHISEVIAAMYYCDTRCSTAD